ALQRGQREDTPVARVERAATFAGGTRMNEFDREPWVDDARRLLDASAQSLDAATLSRLNRARQAALAQRRPRVRGWLPALGLAGSAAAVLLAVALWAPQHRGEAPGLHAPVAAMDSENAADDSLEFYQNLEFYAWLEAQDPDFDG